MRHFNSNELFNIAKRYIPGGVNSPVRAFKAVGGTPFFVKRAEGAYLYTVDGTRLLDYVCTWGPAITGHAHPKIIKSIYEAALNGTSFGMPHEGEIIMARSIVETYPSIEKVRLCNSGTEACMSAIRLARAYTKRNKIIKFAGCYHGHADHLLVKAGSGALTFGYPDSAGVPYEFTQHTIILPFNDQEAVTQVFQKLGDQIAAVILEPVTGNAGVFAIDPTFLTFLRQITSQYNSLLIFDEVMTGFRIAPGGAQGRFCIQPDLTCLGKIIGGGLPIGAFGGKAEIMDLLAPEGPVYQAGTLSGNPISVYAGLAALDIILNAETYEKLDFLTNYLIMGLQKAAQKSKIPVQVQGICSMFSIFFSDKPIRNLNDALNSKVEFYKKFFHGMLQHGIFLPPSPFEAAFISIAHSQADIALTINAAEEVFLNIANLL